MSASSIEQESNVFVESPVVVDRVVRNWGDKSDAGHWKGEPVTSLDHIFHEEKRTDRKALAIGEKIIITTFYHAHLVPEFRRQVRLAIQEAKEQLAAEQAAIFQTPRKNAVKPTVTVYKPAA